MSKRPCFRARGQSTSSAAALRETERGVTKNQQKTSSLPVKKPIRSEKPSRTKREHKLNQIISCSLQGHALKKGLGKALQIRSSTKPELILIHTAAHQPEFRHVRASATVGAAGHAHEQGFFNPEPAELRIQSIQNFGEDAL